MSEFQVTLPDGRQFRVETDKSFSELRKEFSPCADILPMGKAESVPEEVEAKPKAPRKSASQKKEKLDAG